MLARGDLHRFSTSFAEMIRVDDSDIPMLNETKLLCHPPEVDPSRNTNSLIDVVLDVEVKTATKIMNKTTCKIPDTSSIQGTVQNA